MKLLVAMTAPAESRRPSRYRGPLTFCFAWDAQHFRYGLLRHRLALRARTNISAESPVGDTEAMAFQRLHLRVI